MPRVRARCGRNRESTHRPAWSQTRQAGIYEWGMADDVADAGWEESAYCLTRRARQAGPSVAIGGVAVSVVGGAALVGQKIIARMNRWAMYGQD